MNKLKIAVTGSIGSGKSSFCKLLEDRSYPVIKADDLSKDILANDKNVKNEVIKIFGKNSFINNEINKKFLAEKIFSDPENVLIINSILHPKVKEKVNTLMDEYLKKTNIVFVEAALIYEADMENMFDYVVLITADEKIRMKRKTEILSSEEFNKRNQNQIPDIEKEKRADFIFVNNGSLIELSAKADLLLQILKKYNKE
jgi:dephospho-CoA kinase